MSSAPAFAEQARSLVAKEQFGAALEKLDTAIKLRPDLAEAHYNLGLALGEKGQTAEAIESLREAIRLKPGQPDPLGADDSRVTRTRRRGASPSQPSSAVDSFIARTTVATTR